MNCHLCGTESLLVEERRTVPVGDRAVEIVDTFYRCTGCDEAFYTFEMADESLRRGVAALRAEDGLLAPEEIAALRDRWGLSQAAMERLIGAGAKTVVRWERGTVVQNRTADTLLRVLSANPSAVEWLAAERGVRLKRASRAA